MFTWCRLSVEKAVQPTGCEPVAVLWDTRVTSATSAQPPSRGQIQQRGRSVPASLAVVEEEAVTPTLVTATLLTRPGELES